MINPDEPYWLPAVGTYTGRTIVRKLAAGELPRLPTFDLYGDNGVVTLTTAEAKRLVPLPEYQDG